MMRNIKNLIIFFLFWFLLVNKLTCFDIFFGILSLGSAIWVRTKLFHGRNVEIQQCNIKILKLIQYLFFIIGEMIKSAIAVAKIAFKNHQVNPKIIAVSANDKKNHENFIFAHSITFTPGTITFAMENGNLLVHIFTQDFANDLKNDQKIRQKIAALNNNN